MEGKLRALGADIEKVSFPDKTEEQTETAEDDKNKAAS